MKSAGATFRRAGEEIVLPKNVVLEIRLGQLFVFADALTSTKRLNRQFPKKCHAVRYDFVEPRRLGFFGAEWLRFPAIRQRSVRRLSHDVAIVRWRRGGVLGFFGRSRCVPDPVWRRVICRKRRNEIGRIVSEIIGSRECD